MATAVAIAARGTEVTITTADATAKSSGRNGGGAAPAQAGGLEQHEQYAEAPLVSREARVTTGHLALGVLSAR